MDQNQNQLQLEEVLPNFCNCGCCRDAYLRKELTEKGTPELWLIEACWCFFSPKEDRCDCKFCATSLNLRNIK